MVQIISTWFNSSVPVSVSFHLTDQPTYVRALQHGGRGKVYGDVDQRFHGQPRRRGKTGGEAAIEDGAGGRISNDHPCHGEKCGKEGTPVKEPEMSVLIKHEPSGDESDKEFDKKCGNDPLGKAGQKVCQGGAEGAGPDCFPPPEIRGAQQDGGVAQMRVAQRDGNLNDHGHNADQSSQKRSAAERKCVRVLFHSCHLFFCLPDGGYPSRTKCIAAAREGAEVFLLHRQL